MLTHRQHGEKEIIMSKFVIIKKENEPQIMSSFEKAQIKAKVRTVNSFEELEKITKEIDERLGSMPKVAKQGTTAYYNFQQHFPGSYNGKPESTHFKLLFSRGTWRIDTESVRRGSCPNRITYYEYDLFLSETAKENILKRYE